jgi:hypothetical protein
MASLAKQVHVACSTSLIIMIFLQFFLGVAVHFIFGIENVRGSAEGQLLVEAYQELGKAFYAIPINVPGFTWYKALKVILNLVDGQSAFQA